MIEIHRSHTTDPLLDRLVSLLGEAAPPGEDETILVPGRAMEDWLRIRIARRLGICAGLDFSRPELFFNRCLGQLGDAEEAWRPELLPWTVMELLPDLLRTDEFSALTAFFGAGSQSSRRLFLSRTVSELFRSYQLHRPEMLRDWLRGGEKHWQAVLFRQLVEKLGAPQLLDAESGLEENPAASFFSAAPPSRLFLFACASLPPAYRRLLEIIAREIDVYVFSAELPVKSGRKSTRGDRGQALIDAFAGADRPRFSGATSENLHVPEATSFLRQIQAEVLDSTAPPSSSSPSSSGDGSVSVHSCHSPLRQVQVLQDQLLDCFRDLDGLRPDDVAVLLTDVGTYAPLIEAVFGLSDGDRRKIPFSIAGRDENPRRALVSAFLSLLELLRGRFSAQEVLDFLALPPVAQKLGLDLDALDLIGDWIEKSNIRWAVSAQMREQWEQPALEQNTWELGIRRLVLGYAAGLEEPFHGVLPVAAVSGSEAELLGKLLLFFQSLSSWREELRHELSPVAWRSRLLDMLAAMFHAGGEEQGQKRALIGAIDHLASRAESGGYTGLLELATVHELLRDSLKSHSGLWGFAQGKLSFGPLAPARGLRFRVIALLGMDGDAFPRRGKESELDLLRRDPRPTDPDSRSEDRRLFLHAFLAATDRFLVFFTGQSQKDSTRKPPSVVVREWLDILKMDSAARPEASAPRDGGLSRVHFLQPFDPRYFNAESPEHIFSYRSDALAGARALREGPAEAPPFLSGELGPFEEQAIELEDLKRFFRAPVGFLLERRLGIEPRREASPLRGREPLETGGLESYYLGQELVKAFGRGRTEAQEYRRVAATGLLAPGSPGLLAYLPLSRISGDLADLIAREIESGYLDPVEIELGAPPLVGRLEEVGRSGFLGFSLRKLSPVDFLAAWIDHLALCCQLGDSHSEGVFLCQSRQDAFLRLGSRARLARLRFSRPERPRALLADLVSLFLRGWRELLLFFPRTSAALFVGLVSGLRKTLADLLEQSPEMQPPSSASLPDLLRALYRDGAVVSPDASDAGILEVFTAEVFQREGLGRLVPSAIRQAEAKWIGSRNQRADASDSANLLAFGRTPFDLFARGTAPERDLATLAVRVFFPLFSHLTAEAAA